MIGGRVGIKTGSRVGGAIGVGADGFIQGNGVNRDGGSGKYMPSSAAQFTTLSLVTPDEIWIPGPSGDLVGLVGGSVLTAANTPLYGQAVTGWSSTGVRGNAATGNQRFEGTGPNPSTTDVAVLLYVGNMVPDGTIRPFFACGTSPSDFGLSVYDAPGTTIRGRSAGGVSDSVGAYTTAGTAILIANDVTNTRAVWVSNVETRAMTYGAATSGTAFGLGAIGGGTFAAATVLYMARFVGANARALSTSALAKPFLQGLNWTIPW